jgi:MFS family permease
MSTRAATTDAKRESDAVLPARRPIEGNATTFDKRFVAPLYVGTAMNPVNTSLIATALVAIAQATHVPLGRTALLVAVLYLASAIAQPTAGKLAEELGPRRVFVGGALLVLAGGLVGGLAQSFETLLVARVLLGLGTSAGYPVSMLLIRRRAEEAGLAEPPGSVLGGISIAAQATAAVGLPLGGFLVGVLGWRATFFVNVPIALTVLAMLFAWVPPDPPVHGARDLRALAARLDAAGVALFAGSLAALMTFLRSMAAPSWPVLGLALALAAALALWELRASHPFLDLRMLAGNGALTRTYLRMGLMLFGVYLVLYGLSQWLEAGHGLSAQETGFLTLPMMAVAAVTNRVVSTRNIIRGSLVIAAVTSLVASLGVLLLSSRTPVPWFVVITVVFGIAQGTTSFGNQGALYTQAPAARMGTASGLLRTFGYLGAIASSAVMGSLFRGGADDHGLHVMAWILVASSIAVLVLTVADRALHDVRRLRPTRSAVLSSIQGEKS